MNLVLDIPIPDAGLASSISNCYVRPTKSIEPNILRRHRGGRELRAGPRRVFHRNFDKSFPMENQFRVGARIHARLRFGQSKPFPVEPFAQSGDVVGIAGFYDTVDGDGSDVVAGEGAVMGDV